MSWLMADEPAMNSPATVAIAAAIPPAATKPTNHSGGSIAAPPARR